MTFIKIIWAAITGHKAIAASVLAATMLSGAFATGWKVNGWRLSQDIAALEIKIAQVQAAKSLVEGQLSVCRTDAEQMTADIRQQNAAVANLKAETEARQQAAQKAAEKARSESAALQSRIAELRTTRGSTCEDAEQIINKALGL